MNNSNHNQPGQFGEQPVDKTFVEGGSGQLPDFTELQPGTRINAAASQSLNPYTQTGNGEYLNPPDILPNGDEPVPLGSGTVVGLLGTGGMAKVFKIWNEKLEVFRAVKILLPTQQADLKNRFETEAKITAKLHHPNIVEIYGVGDWNNLPYLEMEYIDGVSLEALIVNNGKLPNVVCSAISILVVSALHYAHKQEFLIYGKTYNGVIHRDLKPANIMIPQVGDVRLMDFGIARPTEASLHTVEGNIVGTMQYLSPEQLDGIDIDARSDIYSFGAILYEVLTGTKTFPQDTITNLMKKKVLNEYRKFSDFDFPVCSPLARISQKCLQINKNDRYSDAQQLLHDLEAAHRSFTSESPVAILHQYMSDPDSVKVSRRSGFQPPGVSPKILIPAIGILGIAGLVTVFIITGPVPESITVTKDNAITTQGDKPSPGYSDITEKKPDTLKTPRVDVASPVSKQPSKPITRKYRKPRKPAGTRASSPRKPQPRKPVSSPSKPNPSLVVTQPEAPPAAPQVLSPVEQLKKKYSNDDLFAIGKQAAKSRAYSDVILALKNVPAGEGNDVVTKLLLFEAYLNTGKLGDALIIANRETINDAQFDYLCGRVYELNGKNKRALEYYQSALTKPSSIRSRASIRNDALYQTALLRTSQHRSNPTSDSRIQALSAWNTVKKTYMGTPTHPRFKKANSELASIQ